MACTDARLKVFHLQSGCPNECQPIARIERARWWRTILIWQNLEFACFKIWLKELFFTNDEEIPAGHFIKILEAILAQQNKDGIRLNQSKFIVFTDIVKRDGRNDIFAAIIFKLKHFIKLA